MGTITRSHTFVAGEKPTDDQWNVDIDQLFTLVNGNLDEGNVDYSSSDGIVTMQQTQTITGTKTFDAATTFNTSILPDSAGAADIGTASAEWGDVYIADDKFVKFGSDQNVLVGYDETTTDSLKFAATEGAGLAITLMADEGDDAGDEWKLNVADGGVITLGNDIASAGSYVTHLTLTPHATVSSSTLALAGALTVAGTAGITGVATVGGLTIGSAVINEAELETIDGVTAGTVAASKAVVVDSNKDIGSFRNVTLTGELDAATGDFSGDVDVDGTLEADAITLGGTALGSLYSPIAGGSSIVTTGALDSGSITSGFGTINNGSSAITSTGTVSAGTLAVTSDITVYDDQNNADVSLSMGTGAAEALVVQALNGGSNKTLEELRFTTKTASGTGDHGKMSFYVDEAEIATIDDGGIDLASGKAFTVNGSALSSGISWDGSTANGVATFKDSDEATVESNLTFDGSTLNVVGNAGVGIARTDGTLHVHTATAGSVTPNANEDDLVVENSGNCGITILAPDASDSTLCFGSTSDAVGAVLRWNHDANLLKLSTANAGDSIAFGTAADVEAVRFDASGRLLVGSTASVTTGGANCGIENHNGLQSIIRYDNSGAANSPVLWLARTRSTSKGTVGTTVNNGDTVGLISFVADDGTDLTSQAAGISAAVDGAPGSNDTPGRLMFSTTADGASASTERMRITNAGNVGINNTSPGGVLTATETGTDGLHLFKLEKTNASAAGNFSYWDTTRTSSTGFNYGSWTSGTGASSKQEFLLTGDGNGKADGTWQDNQYDYAEYFESASGEASELGRSVVLDDGKMRYYDASTDDAANIIGITRPKKNAKGPSIHNVAWNGWHERYVTDDFGQYAMEDVTVWSWDKIDAVEASEGVEAVEGREEGGVYERDELAKDPDWTPPADATSSTQSVRKQNPDYDPALADDYKSREDRDEWWLIGLLGQVQIKSDEPTNPRWIKMKSISDAVDMWMIR
jgi:hypothetical protein